MDIRSGSSGTEELGDLIADLGRLRGSDERVQAEALDDVGTDLGCCSGGQGDDGDGREDERLLEPAELFVCGAKVVAPFADAMGFVDRDADQLALLMDCFESLAEVSLGAELWCDVEQSRVRVAAEKIRNDVAAIYGGRSGVDGLCGYANGSRGVDLVCHQREQRRDDDCDAAADEGW